MKHRGSGTAGKKDWNIMVRVQEMRGEQRQGGLLKTGKTVLIKINKLQQLPGFWVWCKGVSFQLLSEQIRMDSFLNHAIMWSHKAFICASRSFAQTKHGPLFFQITFKFAFVSSSFIVLHLGQLLGEKSILSDECSLWCSVAVVVKPHQRAKGVWPHRCCKRPASHSKIHSVAALLRLRFAARLIWRRLNACGKMGEPTHEHRLHTEEAASPENDCLEEKVQAACKRRKLDSSLLVATRKQLFTTL